MEQKEISFEAAMNRLEEIVAGLENNKSSLDESLKLFQEGTELVKYCSGVLESAQQKVTMLVQNGQELAEVPFENDNHES